jgi:hypothetical protein
MLLVMTLMTKNMHMFKNFYKLALLASKSVDKYKKVIENVDMLKRKNLVK